MFFVEKIPDTRSDAEKEPDVKKPEEKGPDFSGETATRVGKAEKAVDGAKPALNALSQRKAPEQKESDRLLSEMQKALEVFRPGAKIKEPVVDQNGDPVLDEKGKQKTREREVHSGDKFGALFKFIFLAIQYLKALGNELSGTKDPSLPRESGSQKPPPRPTEKDREGKPGEARSQERMTRERQEVRTRMDAVDEELTLESDTKGVLQRVHNYHKNRADALERSPDPENPKDRELVADRIRYHRDKQEKLRKQIEESTKTIDALTKEKGELQRRLDGLDQESVGLEAHIPRLNAALNRIFAELPPEVRNNIGEFEFAVTDQGIVVRLKPLPPGSPKPFLHAFFEAHFPGKTEVGFQDLIAALQKKTNERTEKGSETSQNSSEGKMDLETITRKREEVQRAFDGVFGEGIFALVVSATGEKAPNGAYTFAIGLDKSQVGKDVSPDTLEYIRYTFFNGGRDRGDFLSTRAVVAKDIDSLVAEVVSKLAKEKVARDFRKSKGEDILRHAHLPEETRMGQITEMNDGEFALEIPNRLLKTHYYFKFDSVQGQWVWKYENDSYTLTSYYPSNSTDEYVQEGVTSARAVIDRLNWVDTKANVLSEAQHALHDNREHDGEDFLKKFGVNLFGMRKVGVEWECDVSGTTEYYFRFNDAISQWEWRYEDDPVYHSIDTVPVNKNANDATLGSTEIPIPASYTLGLNGWGVNQARSIIGGLQSVSKIPQDMYEFRARRNGESFKTVKS